MLNNNVFCESIENFYINHDGYILYNNFCDNNILKSLYLDKYNVSWGLKLSDLTGVNGMKHFAGKYIIDELYYIIFDFCNKNGNLSIFSPDSFFHHIYNNKSHRRKTIYESEYNSCIFGIFSTEIDRYNFVDLSTYKYLKNVQKLRKYIKEIISKPEKVYIINLLGISLGATNCYFILIELLDILCSNNTILSDLKEINIKAIANTGVNSFVAKELERKIYTITKQRKNLKINIYSVTGLEDKTIVPGIITIPNLDSIDNVQQALVVIDPCNSLYTEERHTLPLRAAQITFKYRIYIGSENIIKYLNLTFNTNFNLDSYVSQQNGKKRYQNCMNIFKNTKVQDLFYSKSSRYLLSNMPNIYSVYYQIYCEYIITQNNFSLLKQNLHKLQNNNNIKNNINKQIIKHISDKTLKFYEKLIAASINICYIYRSIASFTKTIIWTPYFLYIEIGLVIKSVRDNIILIFSCFVNLTNYLLLNLFINKTKQVNIIIERENIFNQILNLLRNNS